MKGQAGAYEGGTRVKTWDPLLWRELHRWVSTPVTSSKDLTSLCERVNGPAQGIT